MVFSLSHAVQVQLKVDNIVVHLVEGGSISFAVDKEKLLRILRHQVHAAMRVYVYAVSSNYGGDRKCSAFYGCRLVYS